MSKQLLLRGILFSFKYPLFMLLGGAEKMCFANYNEMPPVTCE